LYYEFWLWTKFLIQYIYFNVHIEHNVISFIWKIWTNWWWVFTTDNKYYNLYLISVTNIWSVLSDSVGICYKFSDLLPNWEYRVIIGTRVNDVCSIYTQRGQLFFFETLELFSSWYQSHLNLGFLASKIMHNHQSSASSTTNPSDLCLTSAWPRQPCRGSTSELQGLRQGSSASLFWPGSRQRVVISDLNYFVIISL
jgi:hypothetical protein